VSIANAAEKVTVQLRSPVNVLLQTKATQPADNIGMELSLAFLPVFGWDSVSLELWAKSPVGASKISVETG